MTPGLTPVMLGDMTTWITTTDREGRRHYVRADGHIIDGLGYGRMRWTIVYPDGGYGMTDTLAEAKAWAA